MNESSEMETSNTITPEEEIMAIQQEIYMMGANDSEFSVIKGILERLRNKEISAEEAIAQANQIKNNKQDYH
ncbi:MAG: hypothetical protein V1712_01680 [Patescibacteria group bacterium]